MLNYSSIRDLYKNTDRVESNHLVVAEWNMNKYSTIKEFGTYVPDSPPTTYTENDINNVATGDNYFIYDDGSTKLDPSQKYLSKLSSVFEPNRPDPGIVLLQYFSGMTVVPNISTIKVANLSTANARYYPATEERKYDYFNSSKRLKTDSGFTGYGVSNSAGMISMVKPFVVYDGDPLLCNKITVKVQNHFSVPSEFAIDVLDGTDWVEAYSSTSSADFSNGILNIYWNGSAWTKTVARVDDFDELIASTPTQLQQISGIRFRVTRMNKAKASLELIEISPRLEVDVTSYAESFNIASSIGDSTSFGLPVGSVVSGTGNIFLSNEDGQFLFASILSTSKMLNQDVKFSFYQKVYVPDEDETFNIPLGVLYSNQWNIGEDYSVSVDLEDGMKYLRQLSAPDMMISSYAQMSAIILMLLDNVGITGLEFKKSSDNKNNDKEDVVIRNFFCKKEQTVAEVLEQIAIATQCSIFYDVAGNLNVLTKERLSENASIEESIGAADSAQEQKTDFWFISDENVTVSDDEYDYINDYTSNVISFTEEKINPVTDGEVVYHSYGPQKQPLLATLETDKKSIYEQLQLDQFPMNSLAFSNFDYGTTILWQTADDNTSVLGAANLTRDVENNKLSSIHTTPYTAYDEEDAIVSMYNSKTSSENRRSLIIYLDTNEGYTIPDYEGYILLDNEYIKYKGKLFYIAGTNGIYGYRLVFSDEEFKFLIASLGKGDSLSFRGLIVDVVFKITGKSNDKYIYKVVNDGRGKFGTTIDKHFAVAEDSDGIEPDKTFKLTLGESANFSTPGNLSATTKFNFLDKIRYKSAKKILGTIPRESIDTYLGFLKIAGPTGPKSDTALLNSIISGESSNAVSERLKETNKQVDAAVPGDFDDYVYLQGERALYGQKITLDFAPNVISTRMRLYSPRKTVNKDQEIMSTNSSIAGIGFGINANGEGYFLEVESAGAGKDFLAKQAMKNNLRFYKVSLKKNDSGKPVYTPELLLRTSVGGYTVFDTSVQVIKGDNNILDPVFELDIEIVQKSNKMQYTVYYGDTKVGTVTENIENAININSRNVCMFVRNDSQAIFEYIMAAARPQGGYSKRYFRGYNKFNKQLEQGVIPVNKSFLFKDNKGEVLFYFNDFARLARQVKEFDIRFDAPALTSALIDISSVNPQYMVKKYKPTAFGAKLTVANISGGAIRLGADSNLPLYIVGIGLQELSTGTITSQDIYDPVEEDKLRQTEREKNIAIYGDQTFTLDSQYIQSVSQAKSMMRWILKHCNRQRMKITMEVYDNPLIELGDKVRIFDKSRGYYQDNANFGPKTFVVSSVSHSVTSSGPAMNVTLIEVGES